MKITVNEASKACTQFDVSSLNIKTCVKTCVTLRLILTLLVLRFVSLEYI